MASGINSSATIVDGLRRDRVMTPSIATVPLKSGRTVPAIGLGTWGMGERSGAASDEVRALQIGLDLGMTLIDTAEMYGEGGAEIIVGKALAARRDEVYLVSKVYPHNASRSGVVAACERSLKRLGTDRLDLYLLHWPGREPLAETVAGFEALKAAGKIRDWGVSNFDSTDMAKLNQVADSGQCVCNQVLYHLGERGIEWQLLPECQRAAVMVMAYSPLGQAAILAEPVLAQIASKHGTQPSAIALAFLLSRPGVVVIPKAVRPQHVNDNFAALNVVLEEIDFTALKRVFPEPRRKTPLAML